MVIVMEIIVVVMVFVVMIMLNTVMIIVIMTMIIVIMVLTAMIMIAIMVVIILFTMILVLRYWFYDIKGTRQEVWLNPKQKESPFSPPPSEVDLFPWNLHILNTTPAVQGGTTICS